MKQRLEVPWIVEWDLESPFDFMLPFTSFALKFLTTPEKTFLKLCVLKNEGKGKKNKMWFNLYLFWPRLEIGFLHLFTSVF